MKSFFFRLAYLQAMLCCVLYAQQLPFRTYSAKDGLIRNEVRTLCQDARGFLWLGTTDGLVHFDGATFVPHLFAGGLTANFINDVVIDSSGDLWIATNFKGIVRERAGAFTRYGILPGEPGAQENRANVLLPDGPGNLLVGTDGGLFQCGGEKFTRLYPSEPLLRKGVTALLRDAAGTLWIGTFAGLACVPRGTTREIAVLGVFHDTQVNALAADHAGNIWVGTDRGLSRLAVGSAGAAVRESLPAALRTLASMSVLSLLLDSEERFWIGTGTNGVYRYAANEGLSRWAAENGLSGNKVHAMLEDREHNLWFATNAGVCRLPPGHLVNYQLSEGLGGIPVTSITADRDGHMWFGTEFGLARMDGGKFSTYSVANGLGSPYVLTLLTDRNGSVWVGTADGLSLLRASPAGDRFITYRPPEPDGSTIVRTMYQDDHGDLWFGTTDYICRFRNSRGSSVRLQGGTRNELVLAVLEDNGHSLWVGTQDDGIYRYVLAEGTHGDIRATVRAHYRIEDGLSDDNIRSGMKDASGSLWFGTRSGGVNRFLMAGDSVRGIVRYTTNEGLSGGWVRDILQDRDGNIWLATNRGADRLSIDSLGSVHIRTFSVKDGIAGDEVLACYEDSRGDLWFAGSLGVSRYSPSADRTDTIPPPVWITRFQVLGGEDTTDLEAMQADLAADQHSVSFEYIGISFKDESKVRYRYMLEGLDAGWSLETDRRYANYTHLPPGRYVFRVTACNADGIWSSAPARFIFSIAAPFWETWWFIALAVLAIAGSVYGVYRLRIGRILEMEAVRSKIAADLHDDIGSTLSSISIFSEMARKEASVSAPRAAELLHRIGESSRAMLESLDDIVWAINPGNDSLEDILVRMREHAAALFEAHGISFRFDLPEDLIAPRLRMDVRKQLYLVFKEAVNNIVRHSGCTNATIAVTREDHELTLTVSDNGRGFASDGAGRGNGLRNMQTRAASVGGGVRITSSPGKGTTISLRLRIT